MVFKKIAVAALFASALTMVSAPANAAAYLIGGRWYYFSLDYDATLSKVTGRDLNLGTQVRGAVQITRSQVQCGNPQGYILDPGEGPQLSASGTSGVLNQADLDKSDRSKSTFKKTVQVPLPVDPVDSTCDGPANSPNGEWTALYWQNSGCDRGDEATYGVMCYSYLAYKKISDGKLYYVTGPLAGSQVSDASQWTFVYLPTEFSYTSTVYVEGAPTGGFTGTCFFDENPASPGQPYSLSYPPVEGWAKVKTPYVCTEVRF